MGQLLEGPRGIGPVLVDSKRLLSTANYPYLSIRAKNNLTPVWEKLVRPYVRLSGGDFPVIY